MQEEANKQKRITLKTLHQMLDGMSVELAEKVHLLFMANYIDYSDYDFRDENQVEGYCWCYRDLFELKTKESQEIVNSQLIEFLDEWRQDAPSRYRKAKDDMAIGLQTSGITSSRPYLPGDRFLTGTAKRLGEDRLLL